MNNSALAKENHESVEMIIAAMKNARNFKLDSHRINLTKTCFFDTIGATLAGASSAEAESFITSTLALQPQGSYSIYGRSARTDILTATFCNAFCGHLLDFDDTSFVMVGHPSVPIVTAIFGLAEKMNVTGESAIRAYIFSFEIVSGISRAINPEHYKLGWHASATIGAFGAGMASAYLLNQNDQQLETTLGLTATFSSGLKENFGSLAKPIQVAHATRNGLMAALYAEQGIVVPATAFSGNQGFLNLYSQGKVNENGFQNVHRLEELITSGVAVKRYPCCTFTHSIIDTILDIQNQNRLSLESLDQVKIQIHPTAKKVLRHNDPKLGSEAQFSAQYCAALALLNDEFLISSFANEKILQSNVQNLMKKITIESNESLPDSDLDQLKCNVSITLKSGETIMRDSGTLKGWPANPLTWAELTTKFKSCTANYYDDEVTKAIRNFEKFEKLSSLHDFIKVFPSSLALTKKSVV